MGFALIAFFVVFLLIASAGLLLFYREAMITRVSAVITPQAKQGGLRNTIHQTGSTLSSVMEQFEKVVPKSEKEVSVVQQRLIHAGFRDDQAVKMFYGAKVLTPLLFCLLLLISGLGSNSPFFMYAVGLGLGFLAPDFWLGRKISGRQTKIRRALPDVLDLLVVCVEAGLSLDQATQRTAEELRIAHPALSDELSIVVLEQRSGRPRSDAWKNLSDRTGVDTIRNLVSVLIQSEQFGTSVGKTLRVHSETLRTQRRQKVEEQAAKTTVKLVFPLVLFIFPSLFLVTMGPAAITIMESFDNLFH